MNTLRTTVRTIAAAAGIAVALTACSGEDPPEATEGGEASTSAMASPSEAGTTAPDDGGSAAEGVGDLAGVWSLDAEPPEASTLTVDESGYAKYTTEGTIVDYWEGTAVPSSGSTFTIEFTPDSEDDTGGEDLDFTAEVTVDGDTLAWTSDGYDSTYTRDE
ncbi:hypothetical protein [Glycomyces endophyticus]